MEPLYTIVVHFCAWTATVADATYEVENSFSGENNLKEVTAFPPFDFFACKA